MNLHEILQQRADLWRGDRAPRPTLPVIASGHPDLDRQIGGGWPQGRLTEILGGGAGALDVLMPALASLSQNERWLALITPPFLPYAPAFAAAGVDVSRLLVVRPKLEGDSLWALEQALRSGTCSAALAWPERIEMAALRRLQLAAEASGTTAFLFRVEAAAGQASPAALRLQVALGEAGIRLDVLKRRGGWGGGPVWLPFGSDEVISPVDHDKVADFRRDWRPVSESKNRPHSGQFSFRPRG